MTENPSNPVNASLRSIDGDAGGREGSGAVAESDALLLGRVTAKDQQAMAQLFDRYAGMVYSVALRVLKDAGHAEDVMQEVFFRIWREPGAYAQGRGSLGAWLAVVTRNRAVDVLRRRKPSDPVDAVVLASEVNLASEVERNTMMEKVRGILKSLPPEQQRSLDLAYFEGLSHSEIAAQTGDPLGTVKTRIRSALMSVRKALQA
ncbi:MAG: sigma-70 family RNA polymerase sigma factor [Acidobacteriota bacterium]|nr:sigma-70 family RNA polymerase sigma factor [Acidobacteriota bacterium]